MSCESYIANFPIDKSVSANELGATYYKELAEFHDKAWHKIYNNCLGSTDVSVLVSQYKELIIKEFNLNNIYSTENTDDLLVFMGRGNHVDEKDPNYFRRRIVANRLNIKKLLADITIMKNIVYGGVNLEYKKNKDGEIYSDSEPLFETYSTVSTEIIGHWTDPDDADYNTDDMGLVGMIFAAIQDIAYCELVIENINNYESSY